MKLQKIKVLRTELPKEAIREVLKEEITPKLSEMLEYTKKILEKIYNEGDDFFGYNYAYFYQQNLKNKMRFHI